MTAVRTVAVKRCSRCNQTKPTEAFSPSDRARDGFQAWCKDCHASYTRDRRSSDDALAERERARVAAYRTAEATLRQRHRAEFDALYEAELAKRGLA